MKDPAYYPSWKNWSKYGKYIAYFAEYIRYRDWKSLKAALRYVLFNKPTYATWKAKSAMGYFFIRKGTTDFQFINYAYEKRVRNYLKDLVASGKIDVFIDIGACIGEYDIWLARHGIYCIAFEPVNHEALRENILLNQLENRIKVYPFGLGSKQEKVSFKIMGTVTGSSRIDRYAKGGNILIQRLDDMLPELGIDFNSQFVMKLDVEGMETEVLDGARDFIANAKHLKIIFEKYEHDDTVNNKLSALANFSFHKIDRYNYVATKLCS